MDLSNTRSSRNTSTARQHQRPLPGIPYRPSSCKSSGKRSLTDIYKSLGAESFRVVQLHGFSDHGVLQCSFEHIPLPTSQSSTHFAAISYTWSSADGFWYGRHNNSLKLIVINNENVLVSDKVANILNLMLRTGRMTIWIDALSINQTNDAEKSVQVAKMHLIYGCASEVCVVLGSPNERVDSFLDSVNAETTNPAEMGTPQDMLRSYDELTAKERASWRQKNAYGGYLRLARNRYRRRAWIIQELVLGREITLFCGSRSIEFAKLCERVVRLRQVQERRMDFRKLSGFVATSEGIVSKGSMAWIATVKCRLCSQSVDCLPRMLVLELLRDTKGWNQCMDARDILYSKLALATDARALVPRTDYRMPVDALYRNFARAHIELHGNLDIIGFAALARNRLHLPSWVPNWTAASREWAPQRHSKIPSLVYPEQCYPPIISENGLELIVKGRIIDRITTSWFGNLQRLNDNTAFAQSDHGVPLQIYLHPSELPRTGDLICILQGFRTFVYLRPEGEAYRLVGRHELCQNWIQGGKFDFFRLLPNFRVHDPFSYYGTKDLDDPAVLSHALSCPEIEFRIR
ncbi:hypothetical protein CKM354_000832700 [Cercospora kikuchii]|uniref:Heterokaryon incompatibility domain-containing protein n=1 Tax=Cercospora kikuchii TaxID=84275 RepID=A0A9P3CM10_9PEZI|nr:uncharacterized protein CKM354_000832700 [Cercospora kikuchii]GIZ45146.1 hypothetical protein CKM354_000832700 [Cercospora kikuchii]